MKSVMILISVLFLNTLHAQVDTNDIVLCNTIHLDGIDDYMVTDTSPAYFTTSYTIEYWVKLDSIGDYNFFPSTDIGDKGSRYCWYRKNTEQVITGFYTTGFQNAYAYYPLETNQWYHMAYELDENDSTCRLFINGNLIIEQQFSDIDIIDSIPTKMLIGARPSDSTVVTAAEFDEVHYWNYARTQEEIQRSMYHTINPRTYGLIGYWNMNDSNTTTCTDYSPTGNPAILQNCDSVTVWTNNCTSTNIPENINNSSILIYPNPAYSILHINTNYQEQEIIIMDITGKTIICKPLTNKNITIDINNLKSGLYFIKIGNFVNKFIKE